MRFFLQIHKKTAGSRSGYPRVYFACQVNDRQISAKGTARGANLPQEQNNPA